MIYLDHNATAPLRDEARAAMLRALDICGNPSSVHAAGRAARVIVEDAREQVAAFAGARASEVIFTSGGTEANALALRGAIMGAAEAEDRITRVFVAATSHDSVRGVAASLAETTPGLKLTEIPVDENGRIVPEQFRALLMNGKGRVLVSLIFANNETGVIEDIAALAAILRNEGGEDSLLHVDAVSSGYSPIRFSAWGADYLSLAAHKIGGPQGVGALVAREGVPLAPLFPGTQEMRRRAGTENVAGIAGFGAAARAVQANFDWKADAVAAIRDGFETALRHAQRRDLRRGCGAAEERVVLRAAAAPGRNGADGARPRWLLHQPRRRLLVRQGDAVACAGSHGRAGKPRALCAARQLRPGIRLADEIDAFSASLCKLLARKLALARGAAWQRSTPARKSPSLARSTNTASSPTSRWSARPRG